MAKKEKNSKKKKVARKILVMGLDNSGKTSIILSLKGTKNLQAYHNMPPTKDKDIKKFQIMDLNFNVWDFGGQEEYRPKHLENLNDYLFGAGKLIFVFDIQDKERYDIALEYFQKLISLLVESSINIDISVFLHKFDPDLTETHPDIGEEQINELQQKIKQIIPTNMPYDTFKTSIYTIFEKTLLD